jgi:hypothetical protein
MLLTGFKKARPKSAQNERDFHGVIVNLLETTGTLESTPSNAEHNYRVASLSPFLNLKSDFFRVCYKCAWHFKVRFPELLNHSRAMSEP